MIELPPSKSIGARFLVATYFNGSLPIDPFFDDNEDLMVLQQALLEILSDEEPIDYGDSQIDVGASGTALRFVTAVCASSRGADYVITGTDRLMKRPMLPLINLLREAGAGVEPLGDNGEGPYKVIGNKLKGGDFSIRGDISSQFISALMLVAPSWINGMKLTFSTPLVSKPYVEMTARLMGKFGIKVNLSDMSVEVPAGSYIEPMDFHVEADWSSASFFYEAAALGAAKVELANLPAPKDSLQGDAAADALFQKIGVVSSFHHSGAILYPGGENPQKVEASFKDCPDLLLPYAVTCLCKGIHFRFTDVAHLRLKESDRLESLRKESLKLGFVIKVEEDSLEWNGENIESQPDPVIQTYDDHRVAMSFAMVALKYGKIRIENPQVVEKSFIDFWNQIQNLGLKCEETDNIMTVSK